MLEETSFSLRITAAEADVDPAEVEEFAIQLRQELLASGVPGVTRAVEGTRPGGTRGVEMIAAGVGFLVTGLSTAAAMAQLADYVQRWLEAHPRRRRFKVAFVVGSTSAGAVASGATGRRSALLVANAAYQDPGLSQLRSPVADIQALADVLGEPSIGAFGVDMLTDASEAVLRRRVAAFFADREPDDVLLLHFSCHGLKDQRGRLYLAAADTELSSLAATGLPASFVSEQMSESVSRSVLLILDCCYSGAFARDTPVRADRTVHLADEFRSGGTGRTVLTASSATEYSFEGGQITSYDAQPSVFTEALVRGLRTGGADLDHDGEITVDELFGYISQRLREARVGQVPRKWSFETTGALVVARSVRPALLPEEIRSDLASDRRILRLEAVRALAGLLAGPRDGYRQAAREALIDLRDNDDSVQVRAAAATVLGGVAPPVLLPPAVPPHVAAPPEATAPQLTAAVPLETVPPSVVRPAAAPSVEAVSPADVGPRVPESPAVGTSDSGAPPDIAPQAAGLGLPSSAGSALAAARKRRVLVIGAVGLIVAITATIATVSALSNRSQDPWSSSSPGQGSGAPFGTVVLDHDGPIESAELSPDGRRVVTRDPPADQAAAQVARLWNASTGQKLATFDTDEEVVFSPDGSIVASAYFDGKREVTTFDGKPMGTFSGGLTVVSLINTSSGEKVATLPGHKGAAYMLFSPDSKTVATASMAASGDPFDAPIRLWEASTGKLLTTLANRSDGIQSMQFSGDGKVLVTGAAGGVTKVWDVASGRATATLNKAWFPVWISPDGKTLADGLPLSEGGFELRSVPSGNLLASVANAGSFAGFTTDSKAYATNTDGTIRLFDLAAREVRAVLAVPVQGDPVFSPDDRVIAAVGKDGVPALFDAANGQRLTQLTGHAGKVTDLKFAADGQLLFTTGADKTVRTWYVSR